MWQFIQEYWTWAALALFSFFMMKMHMGGGHGMHGSSDPQGASTQASGSHVHAAQPEQPATEQERQLVGNANSKGNSPGSADKSNSAGSRASGHGGCH